MDLPASHLSHTSCQTRSEIPRIERQITIELPASAALSGQRKDIPVVGKGIVTKSPRGLV